MAFKAILDEVAQLRDVGERLEGLAEQHRPVSEALVNIAGNVRNIATVLAVRVDLAAEKSRDSHAALESLVLQRTAALRTLSQRLRKAQDEERRRVARDLHDSTSQTLTGLKMNIATLQKQFENDQPTSAALTDIADIADQALQEIRTTSYLLHPPLLDEAGLASAARWYMEGFSERSGIRVTLHFPSDSERLPNDVEMVLFRVLQESLTNVHRHSGASIVNIRLERSVGAVNFEVHDNGHGIAPDLLDRLQKTGTDTGVGLAGMRERINDLNGQLEMESSSSGTTLRVRVPLASTEQLIHSNSAEDSSLSIPAVSGTIERLGAQSGFPEAHGSLAHHRSAQVWPSTSNSSQSRPGIISVCSVSQKKF
jgi:signal transduction histidine kinase